MTMNFFINLFRQKIKISAHAFELIAYLIAHLNTEHLAAVVSLCNEALQKLVPQTPVVVAAEAALGAVETVVSENESTDSTEKAHVEDDADQGNQTEAALEAAVEAPKPRFKPVAKK